MWEASFVDVKNLTCPEVKVPSAALTGCPTVMLYLAFNGSACHCETERPARHVPYVHRELSLKVYLQDVSLQLGNGQLFFRNVARKVGITLFSDTILSLLLLKCISQHFLTWHSWLNYVPQLPRSNGSMHDIWKYIFQTFWAAVHLQIIFKW